MPAAPTTEKKLPLYPKALCRREVQLQAVAMCTDTESAGFFWDREDM